MLENFITYFQWFYLLSRCFSCCCFTKISHLGAIYFLPGAFSCCSAASFAFLARCPAVRAATRAQWRALKAENFFSSSLIARNSMTGLGFKSGITGPVSCVASLRSSSVASPLRNLRFSWMGKRMSLLWYSFKRWTFFWRDSTDLLRRRLSTAIPTVRANPAVRPEAWKTNQKVKQTVVEI